MLVTEEEAKAKWCPKANVAIQDVTTDFAEITGTAPIFLAGNRAAVKGRDRRGCHLTIGSNCVASGCMWWRWADDAPLYRRHQVTDDRFVERRKVVDAMPDEEWDAASSALDAEAQAFSDAWKPDAPAVGAELQGIEVQYDNSVVATFRELIHSRRGFCGAAVQPENDL